MHSEATHPQPVRPHASAPFAKTWSRRPGDEARTLRLVQGPGVVPLLDDGDGALLVGAARCSVADVLADRGRLSPAEVRGVAVAAGNALARCHALGVVHGDIKPANLLLSPDELWLADFDAAGPVDTPRQHHSPGRGGGSTLTITDDVRALAATALECAIGHPVDLGAAWTALQLADLGCPADLAAELAMILRRPTSALAVAELLVSDDAVLPGPSAPNRADRTPTIEFDLLEWVHAPRVSRLDPT